MRAQCSWRRIIGDVESSNNVASAFFNKVHLFLKDLRFEHGAAKLVSCPGLHLTSAYPWLLLTVNILKYLQCQLL